jgi:WD40 repeat protein
MASFTPLSVSVKWARFLGYEDRLIVAGHDHFGHGKFQILENQMLETSSLQPMEDRSAGHLGPVKKIVSVNEEVLPDQRITCCELAGLRKLNQSFVLFGHYNRRRSISGISFGRIRSSYEGAKITTERIANSESMAQYTSTSFNADHESFAIADETGMVSVYSAEAARQIASFRADAAGVNQLKYVRSGYIVTLSKSCGSSSIKLWDLRMNVSDDIFRSLRPCQELDQPDIKAALGEYTSAELHPSKDQLICGSSHGFVSLFDMRTGSTMNFRPHSRQGMWAIIAASLNLLPC